MLNETTADLSLQVDPWDWPELTADPAYLVLAYGPRSGTESASADFRLEDITEEDMLKALEALNDH